MNKPTAQQKGNALEDAVRAIESTILHAAPGFSEGTFRIQSKRIVVSDGVRHEIDLLVTAALPAGYEATFVFECKNWQEKVGKNDIIVFSEKIKATGAQKGFFVAKSFTKDAVAQAEKDPRIELLTAAELHPSSILVPPNIFSTHMGRTSVNVVFGGFGEGTINIPELNLSDVSFSVDGSPIVPADYVRKWIEEVRIDHVNRFSWEALPDGVHMLEFADRRIFAEGRAFLDGRPVRSITLRGTVEVQLDRAVVMSVFEVKTRGRLVTVEINSPVLEVAAQLVELDSKYSAGAV
jgi:hypothetical protein